MSDDAGGPKQSPSENDSRDEIIGSVLFPKPRIDISSFTVDNDIKLILQKLSTELRLNKILRWVKSLKFSQGRPSFDDPGLSKDGTVKAAPSNAVTDLAVHGEKDWVSDYSLL